MQNLNTNIPVLRFEFLDDHADHLFHYLVHVDASGNKEEIAAVVRALKVADHYLDVLNCE
jgi:hypothetical protein